jgi:hypothetical protein
LLRMIFTISLWMPIARDGCSGVGDAQWRFPAAGVCGRLADSAQYG